VVLPARRRERRTAKSENAETRLSAAERRRLRKIVERKRHKEKHAALLESLAASRLDPALAARVAPSSSLSQGRRWARRETRDGQEKHDDVDGQDGAPRNAFKRARGAARAGGGASQPAAASASSEEDSSDGDDDVDGVGSEAVH